MAALVARRTPVWVPDLDLAFTELRVRDVGGPNSPLIGLPGRIGTPDRPGSHPGPISFYLLAPAYRLLGSSAWSLQVATVLWHLAAAATTVALVARRSGPRAAAVAGGLLALLITALGPNVFTEPWNPHLPLLWWSTFLVAAWLVLCGDALGLPALAVAGALCAQTHVPYLAPVAAITVVAAAVGLRRTRGDGRLRWAVSALLLAIVVWAPPIVDQLRHDPGNLRVIVESAQDPSDPPVGWADGARLALERFDLVELGRGLVEPGRLAEQDAAGASDARGAALVVLALASAAARWRASAPDTRALAALAGGAALLYVVSVARIPGFPWTYLLLWGWTIAGALAWTFVSTVARARPTPPAWARRPSAAAVGVVVAIVSLAWAGRAGSQAEPTNPVTSRTVLALVHDVLDDLDEDARYQVAWNDPVHLGAHGVGVFLELERRGIDVVVDPALARSFGDHRTDSKRPEDRRLIVASGAAIARWDEDPDARRLAAVDARTSAERAETERLAAELVEVLRDTGRDDLVPAVEAGRALNVALDVQVDPAARRLALRLDALGAPAAVYLVDAG